MDFERVDSETVFEGKMITLRRDRFRHDDGEVTREVVAHPGAVAMVAHDGDHLYMVSQPREAVGEWLLELPAGKLEEGEEALATAKRELAEEIGRAAASWELLAECYSSPGFTDEKLYIYLATDLSDAEGEPGENERIEVHRLALADIGKAIRECRDAKSLIGLLCLEERLTRE